MSKGPEQILSHEDVQMTSRYMKRFLFYWLLGRCKWKPQWGTTSHLVEWPLSTRQAVTRAGEVVEKRNPHSLLVRMWPGAAAIGTVWNFLKKLRIKLPYDPEIPLLVPYPKNLLVRMAIPSPDPTQTGTACLALALAVKSTLPWLHHQLCILLLRRFFFASSTRKWLLLVRDYCKFFLGRIAPGL